jgi:hypothetical protein
MAYAMPGIVAYDFDNDFSEMFAEASNLILSNHSYGIIAGWGITFTILVVALVIVTIRTINLQRRVDRLESRLIHAERDYNLSINNQKSK